MPEEGRPGATELCAASVQLFTHPFWSTKEHADIRVWVVGSDPIKLHVQVGASKTRPSPQSRHRIRKCRVLVDHQITDLRMPHASRQEGMDLNKVVQILRLERQQQRLEPFKRLLVTTDPEKVHLVQLGRFGWVVDSVPDTFEHRGKRRHTDTGTHEHCHLVLEDVLRGCSKRSINHDPRQDRHKSIAIAQGLLPLANAFCITSQLFAQLLGEIADDTHMDRQVILLWGTGQRERMPLPQRDLGAAQKDVLAGQCMCVFLLDLNLDDLGGMQDDTGNHRLLFGTPFTCDTFHQIDESTSDPVLPETRDVLAVRGSIGRQQTEGSVERKEEEKDQEEMMPVPKDLELLHPDRGQGRDNHDDEDHQHDVARESWS